ncbi:MAG: FMN-dependent NADH-azoreductase [Cellvibrionaceae bacterium]
MNNTILQIDSSARYQGSLSRELTQYLSGVLAQRNQAEIIYRDLSASVLPFVTEKHIGAYYTPKENRSEEQRQLLVGSDELITELRAVNTLVIGAPIYNFSVPATLKAWIDLVCRVGETFQYGEAGPEGLLDIDNAYIITSAGGTAIGSDIDFNSQYLQQICRFIGVKKSHVIDVSGSKRDSDTLIDFAKEQINNII